MIAFKDMPIMSKGREKGSKSSQGQAKNIISFFHVFISKIENVLHGLNAESRGVVK
jgi:hypothetical protein